MSWLTSKWSDILFDRSKEGGHALNAYLTKKHDLLLAKHFRPNTYIKKSSLAIVDGFAVEMTEYQVLICLCACTTTCILYIKCDDKFFLVS